MKIYLVILFIISPFSFLKQEVSNRIMNFSQISIDRIKFFPFYDEMIQKIEKTSKIDTIDAKHIKMLSSSSFIAFEQYPKSIVKKYGKINEKDFINFLMVESNS